MYGKEIATNISLLESMVTEKVKHKEWYMLLKLVTFGVQIPVRLVLPPDQNNCQLKTGVVVIDLSPPQPCWPCDRI